MTEKKKVGKNLSGSETKGLQSDILDGRDLEFCMKKWNISRPTYYYHRKKILGTGKESPPKPKMTLEQELEVKQINSNVSELAQLIMKYVRKIDSEDEASMNMFKEKIKVFRDCIESIDAVRHGIMAYEFEESEELGDTEIPAELADLLMSRLTEKEKKELLFNEQTKESLSKQAGKKGTPTTA